MFKFESKHDGEDHIDNTPDVIFIVPSESTVTEMIEAFDSFLKAAGYHFDGVIDIVEETK